MISRLAAQTLHELAAQFPAVLLAGPRQCGKTTLARGVLAGEYFDLERPSDRQVFSGDPELALRRLPRPLILDEAQTLPELFPVLRSLIDDARSERGQYFLLGSVSPALLRHVSESLAGRVGILELTPFLLPEARAAELDLYHHWLRGGFPDACLEPDPVRWMRWQENYLATAVERDLSRLDSRVSPAVIRRLLAMVAAHHGGLLNASELGRSLGVTYHSVQSYLDILEGHFLIRRLLPYHANLTKRLVRAPKLYVRDSGVLHHLLGIDSDRRLLESPKRGASFEGYAVEQLIGLEALSRPGTQAWFYRTHAGAEVDLVLDRGTERVGYEIKAALSASPADWANLSRAREDGVIDRGVVVYLGDRQYEPAEGIGVVGASTLLAGTTQAH